MTVHQEQAEPKYKNSCMTCRAYVQIPLYVDGLYDSPNTQILKNPQIILVHLAALENGRKSDIFTLKKERGGIFSECGTKIFKEKFLRYVNELLFEMVKIYLKDTHLGVTTPTTMQDEVSTYWEMHYNKETWVMV